MLVAIFGAGPAGMSCANACLSFGLTPVVIERSDHVGGAQRSNFHPNLWLLGSPSESGQELTRRLVSHFGELKATSMLGTRLLRAEKGEAGFNLQLDTPDGRRELTVGAIVITTGMQPRATPELQELAQESPRVVIGPLNESIRDDIHNAHVLILGGGDNALDHALFLAERGNRIRVCTRGAFSARKALRDACETLNVIELRNHCQPDRLTAGPDAVRAEWGKIGVRYDWLLVMYGYRPNTAMLDDFSAAIRPALKASGHLHVDGWQRTSVPGVYAAGDVTDSPQPSVPTAIAQGLAAARAIERDHHVP